MAQPGTRADWIQHDPARVQRAVEYLPHLWREAVTPATAAAAPTTPHDESHAHSTHAAPDASAQERLAEAEARFAAELATVREESEQWRTHALTVEAEARRQGFAAGHAEGMQQGRADGEVAARAEAQQSLARLTALADDAVVALCDALMASHATLATLSVAVARAIVGEAFALDPALLTRRLVTLLERLSDVTTATVRLHPTDLALVQAQWPGLGQTYGWGEQGPRLLGDDALTPGGCIIAARTHYLDASIETLCNLVAETFAAIQPPATRSADSNDAPPADTTDPALEEAA